MSTDSVGIRTTVGDLYDRATGFYGARTAVTHGSRSYTYAELRANSSALVSALQSLGITKSERVAFLMANCAEYIFCEYAVAKSGATRVPLAVLLTNDDHIYMMNFAECRALIYHVKLAPRVLEMVPRLESVRHYICVSDNASNVPPGHLHLQSLVAAHAQAEPRPVPLDPEDLAGIYFTGGTTGQPKGVMLSHRSWIHTYYAETLDFGVGWGEVFVYCTPMTHAAGCLILPVLLRGGRCVVLDHFEPELLLATIARERATATMVVPTMLYMLLDSPVLAKYDLSTLRNIMYGASVIAPERLKQALRTFGPVLTQFYGQTEAPMALAALPREAHVVADPKDEARVLSSTGRATYPTQIRLVDDAGNDVPPGEPGELVARSPNVMSGYLKNPQASAAALRDGWLYTGDVARIDEQGFITIVDRKKDVIISGGFNIYPRDAEDALFEHPAVKQAAVIGAPHEKWGEEVKAVVVLHAGKSASEAELIEHVKARKGSLNAPKSIEFWDAIPLTNLGKLDKKAIRAHFWKGRERKI